jgi:hypothetical protein
MYLNLFWLEIETKEYYRQNQKRMPDNGTDGLLITLSFHVQLRVKYKKNTNHIKN